MVLIYCLGTNNKQNDLAQKRYQSAFIDQRPFKNKIEYQNLKFSNNVFFSSKFLKPKIKQWENFK